jgi:hypothetical protein
LEVAHRFIKSPSFGQLIGLDILNRKGLREVDIFIRFGRLLIGLSSVLTPQ